MIITQKKPIDELMAMLGDAQKIAILGCASCPTASAPPTGSASFQRWSVKTPPFTPSTKPSALS